MPYPARMTVDMGGDSETTARSSGLSVVFFGGLASMGAGAVHAAAAGIHAEHRQLAQIFIVTAALQLGVGLWAVLRPTRSAAWAVVIVNVGAVAGWLYTRLGGISWIEGLEVREAPQFADTACAVLAAIAVIAAYTGAILPADRRQHRGLLAPAVLIGAFAVWTMLAAGTHVHSHADGESADGHDHGTGVAATDDHTTHAADALAAASEAVAAGDGHVHTDEVATDAAATETTEHVHTSDASAEPAALAWPRPWDPTQPIDLSGVPGVTADQQLRATKLVEDTLADLPRYADTADAIAAGYSSIGDAGTGSEHFIKTSLIEDDDLLDPLAPESLVYTVENGQRTLAGAMYIASARPADDPSLTDWAGPLMTWHKHDNLCWSLDENGAAKVVGIIDADGNCANGVRTGGANPMVHVWIQPHPCGVFAALEGIGAGTAAVPEDQRVDTCTAEHDHGTSASGSTTTDTTTHDHATTAVAKPYDPTLPIDLSGTPGVTPQQQAAAENLIAVTLVELPQWSDYHVAEAAGFQSIGDGATGFEHYVQWDWIEDDTILDPNHPESLVYEPQPDGSKKLVSAMYMTSSDVALEDVPDIGGALMQWHIHNNLCYSGWPAHPRVAGVTSPNGACPSGLVNPPPAPMIHVWIVPQECGPFAALDGVGAGQIEPGAERLCDTAHGGH